MKIIAVGKIKKGFVNDGIKYFQKQISKLEIIEVKQSNIKDEAILVLNKIKERDYVIALAIEGPIISSEDLAVKIDNLKNSGREITFVIGGSTGLDDSIFTRSDELLSFSKLTFPHELFRLMLVEQIYRAEAINQGKPYHK
jgi:23S rRNA (pseudouridine1915-N3)-methyltransferase